MIRGVGDPLCITVPGGGGLAIITAPATTSEVWTAEDNHAANEALRDELERGGKLLGTITGYSSITQHAEPGYAAALGFE